MSPKEISGLMGSHIQTILNIGILLAYGFGNKKILSIIYLQFRSGRTNCRVFKVKSR